METGWKPNVEVSPACPRCGSSNTKFCYYNNYSLTQPRYFCKGCRRYWTKGGSLRNVPIGGGCRKSRRGKSIRASSTAGGVNSRNSAHNPAESSSSIPAEASTSSIDLAAVYANFLNQAPRPQDRNQIETVSDQQHQGIAIPSIEFSNSPLGCHLPQEMNGFFECGQFNSRLPETTQLFGPGGGNSMFLGGLEQFTTGNDVLLPPLPGEGMVWPNPDEILPNQMQGSQLQPAQLNSQVLNGNMIMSPFSGLNLEAIFRS